MTASPSAASPPVAATSPLRNARFRLFYFGTIGVALGYTIQATVAAWLMATMTPSALMVALVQTASTAPTLVLGLFAGALADIFERRKVLLATQYILLVSTLVLGGATVAGYMVPSALLVLTFVIGAGFTLYFPAQQASINDLVPRSELARAVALGAVAFNVARAAGPALAGALVAWIGSGSTLLASAAFFVAMIVVVGRWERQEGPLPGVPETLVSGMLSGLRYARHSVPMRSIIIRNLSFSVCASALWALLPVIARDQLGLGAGGFGLLFGSFGAGAVAGALAIPRHIQKYSLTRVVTAATLFWVMATTLIAATPYTAVAVIGTGAAGAAWVGVLASLSAGTQSAAPAWVRARAVAMNLLAAQASLAIGSVIWGVVATYWDTRISLLAAATVMLLLLFANRRVRVRMGVEAEVTPGAQLPDLGIAVEPQPDDGPVLIQIEYRVDAEQRDGFLRAIRRIGPTRRRNGAVSWRVYRDIGDDGRFVERYILESWAEYVRLRARMTMADRKLQEEVAQYQRAGVADRRIATARCRPAGRGGCADPRGTACLVPLGSANAEQPAKFARRLASSAAKVAFTGRIGIMAPLAAPRRAVRAPHRTCKHHAFFYSDPCHAYFQFQCRPCGASRGRPAPRRSRNARLAWQRHVGDGDEPSRQGVHQHRRQGAGGPARAAVHSRQLQGAVPAGRCDRGKCDRADEPHARPQHRRLRAHRRMVEEVDQGSAQIRDGQCGRVVGGRSLHLHPRTLDLEADERCGVRARVHQRNHRRRRVPLDA